MSNDITVQDLPNDIGQYLHKIKIPKKTGGVRIIYAPQEPLKSLQKKALQELYRKRIRIPGHITAYKRNCSAFTNASRHFGYKASVKFDLQSYFDSIGTRKLWEVLRMEGIYGKEAEYLIKLGTYKQYLYQGSCLSPFFANLTSKHCILPRLKTICYPYRLPIYIVNNPDFTISFIVQVLPGSSIYTPSYKFDVFDITGNMPKVLVEIENWKIKYPGAVNFIEGLTAPQIIEIANEYWSNGRQIDKDRRLHFGYTNASGHNGLSWCVGSGSKLTRHSLGRTILTIYSDDVVISSNNLRLNMLKYEIEKAVRRTGFHINRKKGITVMRSNPHITGYNISSRCNNATSARLSNTTLDKEIRRPLYHLKTGKQAVSEDSVRSLAGKISYIKKCNPNHYQRYIQQLKEITDQSPELLKLLPK